MSVNTKPFETRSVAQIPEEDTHPSPLELASSDPLTVAAELHRVVFSGLSNTFDRLNTKLRSIGECASAQMIASKSPDCQAAQIAGIDSLRPQK